VLVTSEHPIDVFASSSSLVLSDGTMALVSAVDWSRLSAWSWHKQTNGYVIRKERIGTRSRSAERSGVKQKWRTVLLHREIMGAQRGEEVDHINRDRLDNRRSNLRLVTHKENCQNRDNRYYPKRRDWPTATQPYGTNRGGADKNDPRGWSRNGKPRPSLEGAARSWPTARVWDATKENRQIREDSQNGLTAVVLAGPPAPESRSTGGSRRDSWQTPTVTDGEGRPYTYPNGDHSVPFLTLLGQANKGPHQNAGALNPDWVSCLMGFPVDWLHGIDAPGSRPSATPSCAKSSTRSEKPSTKSRGKRGRDSS
jgi:hypothetical protein